MKNRIHKLEDFDVFGLSAITNKADFFNNEHINSAKRFVTSLTPERNGEDGSDFWAWMLEHLLDNLLRSTGSTGQSDVGFCETLFLFNRQDSNVIGTISAVRDDRGRGARYNLPGIWIGGFNVLPEFQGRGIGGQLLDILLEHIEFNQRFIFKKPLTVNLFTKNPSVRKMVEERGFVENKEVRLDTEDKDKSFYFRASGI